MATAQISPCNLCPRHCGALRDRGQRGACGADATLRAARAALHFWEEPPLSGEAGSGAVFLSHCALGCVYCQNAPLSQGKVGWELSVDAMADICLDLQAKGAMNVNFVTPTHYAPILAQAVRRARERGLVLPVVWNTSGYEEAAAIEALAGTVDVYLCDFKYGTAAAAQRYSQARDYPAVALDALEAMVNQVGPLRYDDFHGSRRLVRGVVVRHLLLPGGIEDSKAALAAVWSAFGDKVAYSLMSQYTPFAVEGMCRDYPELCRPVTSDEYEALLDFADGLGMEDYFWQEGGAAHDSFIPVWDGTGLSVDAADA